MLQEIFVLQKINGHSYLDGAYSYCLLGSKKKHKGYKEILGEGGASWASGP